MTAGTKQPFNSTDPRLPARAKTLFLDRVIALIRRSVQSAGWRAVRRTRI